jgi:hypothetical protein
MLSLPVSAQSLQEWKPCIIFSTILQHEWKGKLLYLLDHETCSSVFSPLSPYEAMGKSIDALHQVQVRAAGSPQPESHKHFIIPRLSVWKCTA